MKRLMMMFILVAGFSFAQEMPRVLNQQEVIGWAKDVSATQYPDADDACIASLTLAKYEPDGTYTEFSDDYFKVLTERGMKDSQTYSLPFNATFSEAQILLTEIIKPDGTVVPIDVDANSRVSTDNSSMDSNIYDPAHQKITLSIAGLEVGDVIHLRTFEKLFKPRVPNFYATIGVFQYAAPIIYLEEEVSAPDALPLVKRALRNEIAGTLTSTERKEGDRTIYTWVAKNVPQFYPEPAMPASIEYLQRSLASTAPSWEHVSRWYWGLCEPHMVATPAIKAKTAELIEGLTDDQDKVKALFKFVSQEIRYMGIIAEAEAPGYEPHDASLTFDNRYGVCRDKAVLLAVMLREAGFEAYPVLIHAGMILDPEVPLVFFNHAITCILDKDGKVQLMDTTDETTRDLLPAYLSNRSYLVAHPKGKTLATSPVATADENALRIDTKAAFVSENTLDITSRLEFSGINDGAYRQLFISQTPSAQQKILDGIVREMMPGATLTEFTYTPKDAQDITQPLVLTLKVRAPEFAIQNDKGVSMMPLPWFSEGFGVVNFTLQSLSLDQRKYDLQFDSTCSTVETLSVEGMDKLGKATFIPDDIHFTTNALDYTRTLAMTNSTLVGTRRIAVEQVRYTPEAYQSLRQMMVEIQRDIRQQPLFVSDELQDADVEILDRATTITLKTPTSYTREQAIRERILTYKGKKDCGEFQYEYNPAFESFTLKLAQVTGADGSISSVSDKEINDMDAGWTSSAQRYPNAKIRVVSLPKVEVGSVIDVSIATEVSKLPFLSYTTSFGENNPVRNDSFTVRVPLEMSEQTQIVYYPGRPELQSYMTTTVTTNQEFVVYSYVAKDLPKLPRESAMPSRRMLGQPTIRISTVTDLAHYADDLYERIEDLLDQDTSKTRDLAKTLTKGLKGDAALTAIRDYVSRNIRQAPISFMDLPYLTITNPDTVLTSGYGHRLDTAILLQCMCRAAGFDDATILIAANTQIDTFKAFIQNKEAFETPQRSLFTTPLVRVTSEERPVILNDTNIYTPLGATNYEKAPCLVLDGEQVDRLEDNDGKWDMSLLDVITVRPSETTRTDRLRSVVIHANGDAVITDNLSFYGMALAGFRRTYSEMQTEDRRRHILDLATRILQSAEPYSELITDIDNNPGHRHFSIFAPEYAVREGNYLVIPMSTLTDKLFNIRGDKRTMPVLQSNVGSSSATVKVYLPVGTKRIVMAPSDIDWTLPNGTGTYRITCKQSTNPVTGAICLTYTIKQNFNPGIYGVELYPALLEMNRRLAHPSMARLVIEL